MKLSFTTLSCPEWDWNKIVESAVSLGYDGIEIRGVQGEMYLPNATPFLPENIDGTMAELKQKNIEICCLDTSCMFHDDEKFNAAVDEGKATIDLAAKLSVPYIRVFGNNIPDMSKKDYTVSRLAEGLETLGKHAEDKGVMVLLETHGDFSSAERILQVLSFVNSPAVGILWDINHPYKLFGESMEDTFSRLGKYIKHVHIKDSIGSGETAKLVLVGKGDLPVLEAIEILKKSGYEGYLSFEWEKKWHPEIAEPEVALPAYINYLKKYI